MVEATEWDDVLEEVTALDGPAALFDTYTEKAQEETDGDRSYISRRTESEPVGGQCAYGRQIRSQTYYGMTEVLGQLNRREDEVAVRPMDDHDAEVEVIEVYPAATFDDIKGGERSGYKAKRQPAHGIRMDNREALREAGVTFSDPAWTYAVCDDNALDSIAAALAVHRANTEEPPQEGDRYDSTEGYIYV